MPYFPAGTPVLALPSWSAPRLFLPATTPTARWRASGFYPAFRFSARLFRVGLRVRAAALPLPLRRAEGEGWPLGSFLEDALPDTERVAVLVGTPGPTQKTIVQCRDGQGRVIGYVKVAETPTAQRQLRREAGVLRRLPAGLGPAPLLYAPWKHGEALALTPVAGCPLPGRLPPPEALLAFAARLQKEASAVPLEAHPWVQRLARPEAVAGWLEALAGRSWPLAVQHGDLTPWNLLRQADGRLAAIDWEYGGLDGFPHLDLAFFVLQTAFLIYHWPHERAAAAATAYLRQAAPSLSQRQARALVALAAYEAFVEMGGVADTAFQQWRLALFAGKGQDSGRSVERGASSRRLVDTPARQCRKGEMVQKEE